MLLQEGIGAPKNPAVAFEWARQSAENGFAGGERLLAQYLWEGFGHPRDVEAARGHMKRAAEMGDAIGELYYGDMLANGNGGPVNATEAVRWYQRHVDRDAPDAYGMFKLGLAYYEGMGVPKNVRKAHSLFSQAYKTRNDLAMIRYLARTMAGVALSDPSNNAADRASGRRFLENEAANGSKSAARALADIDKREGASAGAALVGGALLLMLLGAASDSDNGGGSAYKPDERCAGSFDIWAATGFDLNAGAGIAMGGCGPFN